MADHHANPVDEPLDDAHPIGIILAEGSTGATASMRWIPALEALESLEALVADLRRMTTEHTADNAGRIGENRPRAGPASAGRRPDGDPAASRTRPRLTRREAEVLGLTEAGQSAALIAKMLHVTVGTVYVHRRNARRKLREHEVHLVGP